MLRTEVRTAFVCRTASKARAVCSAASLSGLCRTIMLRSSISSPSRSLFLRKDDVQELSRWIRIHVVLIYYVPICDMVGTGRRSIPDCRTRYRRWIRKYTGRELCSCLCNVQSSLLLLLSDRREQWAHEGLPWLLQR